MINRDPWDPLFVLQDFGEYRLTSVEFTVTNLCNMRCEHCAVGDSLVMAEPPKIPLLDVLHKLDEIETLRTISITGGEPSFHNQTMEEYVIPLLRYARERGIKTQLNSNVTLDYSRYEALASILDVLHISFNYRNAQDFHEIGFANATHPVSAQVAEKLYEQMIDNTKRLVAEGLFVSAESMINHRTHEYLPEIHQFIVEMGCKRHEVHPMYPSSFAAQLPSLSLEQTREAISRLLDHRDPNVWMLFGTLPYYHCNGNEQDRDLLGRLKHEPNVTVRNDPDGRNRLNVDLFTGNIRVTDFSTVPPLGNIKLDSLPEVFERWKGHSLYNKVGCYCPEVSCCGPNLLVADTYYRDVDFNLRKAIV